MGTTNSGEWEQQTARNRNNKQQETGTTNGEEQQTTNNKQQTARNNEQRTVRNNERRGTECREQRTTGNGNNNQQGTTNGVNQANERLVTSGNTPPSLQTRDGGVISFHVHFQFFICYVITLHCCEQLLAGCLCLYFILYTKVNLVSCEKTGGKPVPTGFYQFGYSLCYSGLWSGPVNPLRGQKTRPNWTLKHYLQQQ
jgi:hypothetical protein